MKAAIKTLAVIGLLLLAPSFAVAQDYPTKPVRLVIPFAPGGGIDVAGRILADRLSKLWGKAVVVENMAGAGGTIAASNVVRSPKDGYSLLLASASFVQTAVAQKNLTFDFSKDLLAVGKVAEGELIIVTGRRVPMKTVADIVREAKAQKIFYGSTGPATTPSFMARLLSDVTGITMEGVNYKGGAEVLVDLIGGRIDLYVGTISTVLSAIQDKTATPVAVLTKTRSAVLPDVPTIAELGYPSVEADFWYGIFAPAGTPNNVVTRINTDMAGIMKSPEMADLLAKQGAKPSLMPGPEFAKVVESDLVKFRDLAVKYNIVSE